MLLRQIEYFQAVVECNNFYEAAEKCNVSQSAISQQVKKLEDELGVKLIDRHNRTFSLTPAGEHFYRKSLAFKKSIDQLIKETQHIGNDDDFVLRLGCYKGYHGNELSNAIAAFSQKHPKIKINVTVASHDELYYAMENGTVDVALNDQRRAFSTTYNNLILSESTTYIEISTNNPLSNLNQIEATELENTPYILVINSNAKAEEQKYYSEIVGLHGNFIYADSLQDARLMIIAGQGCLPVDVIGEQEWFDSSVKRIPLVQNGEPVTKTYCAFWKKDNSGYYIEEFSDMLKEEFS